MKKLIIITGILGLCSNTVMAQGVVGIFTQQDSKDKTMLQQIALQETYLSAIKTGYKNTENGLNTIHDIKNGSYSLNQGYFNSLSQVSPAVMNNPKIKLITTYQQQIISSFDNEISWESQQSILSGDEMNYIEKVYSNILSECTKDIDELNIVVTPGKAQMKDAERINQIDRIYTSTNDKYKFSMDFTQNVHAFTLNRENGKQQMQTLKKLYNIN